MPFSFPASPSVGDTSTQNGRTYSWSGYAWEIVAADLPNDAVTYAKIQNVSATDRLLGRSSAGAGDVEEITCTSFGRSLIDDTDAAAARTTLSVQPTASPTFTGNARVNSSDSATSLLVNGATKGVRFATSSTATSIEGVDSTGTGSYQPLIINGSTVTIQSNGGTSAITVSTSQTATFAGQIIGQAGAVLTGTVAGNVRQLRMQTSGSTRWEVGPGFDAESGSNVGSTFWITRWSDAGVFLGTPISIARATGVVTFESQVLVNVGSGSAGSYKPGLAINGDDDTGVQQVGGANTLSVVTAGNERLRVTDSRVFINGNGEQYGLGVRYVSNGGAVHFGATSNSATPDAAISNSGGGTLMTLQNGGNVGIGTTSPPEKLSVFGDNNGGRTSILIDNLDQRLKMSCFYQAGVDQYAEIQAFNNAETGFHNLLLNRQGGDVLIGTATDSGAYKLQVNSQIYATNATIATSDARFKANVEALTDATSVIEALRPVAFDFIPQSDRNFAAERQVGLIAQEAQAALAGTDYADSVVAQCGDHLGLAYEKLVPVLIKALQESNARIAALEEQLNG